ncbi:MAG: hypothetical protein AAB784_00330 [Patescibacteria group bacterium]
MTVEERETLNRQIVIEDRLTESLKISKRAWENSGMPVYNTEIGKIALAILAVKTFDELRPPAKEMPPFDPYAR